MARGESKGHRGTSRTAKVVLRQVLESLPLPGLILDPRGRVAFANPTLLGLTGWSRRDLQGKSWFRKVSSSAEEAKSDAALFRKARDAEGGTERILQHLVTRAGERRNVLWDHLILRKGTGIPPFCAFIGEDITERKCFEEILSSTVREISGETGERFFHALVKSLCRALLADCVFVGRLAPEAPERVQTLAVFTPSGEAPNFEYPLAGSPCETVAGRKPSVYPSEVVRRFPEDGLLREVGAEGYAGIPLWGERGNPLGILVALFRSPIPDPEGVLFILQLFGSRAASEMMRKEATAALMESRGRYEGLVNSLEGMVYEIDLASRTFTYMSPRAEAILGYPPERWMGDLSFWAGLIHEEDRDRVLEASTRARAEGKPEVLEYRMRAEDGRVLWIRDSVRFLPDGGPPRVMRGLGLDVTKEKEAELALRESEERYRTIADYTFDWETWIDADHAYRYVSPAVERITGYAPAELLGDRALFERMIHSEDREKVHHHIYRDFERDASCGMEFRIRAKGGGEERWIHHVCRPVYDAAGRFLGRRASNRDITDRKAAEEALRKSEELFRTIVENEPECVKLLDREGRILEMNQAGLDMIEADLETVRGEPARAIVAEEDRPAFDGMVERVFRGERSHHVFNVIGLKGTRRTLESIAVPLRSTGENGPVTTLLGVTRDITERKRAEEALRESEHKYRTLFAQSGDYILVFEVGEEGIPVIMDANESAVRAHGYSREELLGKPISFLDSGSTPEDHRARMEKIRRGELAQFTVRHRRKDGILFDVEVRAQTVKIGAGQFVITSERDITERLRAEEERRASEVRHRMILRTALDGFWQVDLQGRLREVNEAYCRMSGYSEAELLSMTISGLEATEASEDTAARIRKVLSEGEGRFESRHRRKDGSTFEVEISVQFRPDEGGRLVAFLRDITERRRHDKLLKARNRLFEMAPVRSIEDVLRATLDEAEEVTGSTIGFFHFLGPDQKTITLQMWSTRTLGGMCTAEAWGMEYQVDRAGVWAECVRERGPVIHNDYRALPHRRELPEGHARILRELVVPVVRGGAIVAIFGVGNKAENYVEEDIRSATELASLAWEIVERKRAEERLRASERRYRLLADNIHDVIWTIDVASRRINYASPSIRTMRGLTVEEALAEPIDAELSEGGMEFAKIHLEDRIRRFMEGDESLRVTTRVVRQRHKDGRWIDVEMVTTLLPDASGRVREVLGVSRDITARVRAEEENRRLAVAVEQMVDGILIVGGDGRIAYANPAFRRITRFSEERIIGEHTSILASRPEGHGSALGDLLDVTRTAQPWQGRFWFGKAGGGEFLADARVFPIRDAGGGVTQFVAFVRDVTEEVAFHEKLHRAQELERLGRLVGGVAHEVRNPLNAILASTEALAMDLGENPEYKPLFEVIRSQLNRMSDLMRELLELGKPIPRERLGRCSLREICQETIGVWLQSHFLLTKGRVRVELPRGEAAVRGDRTKLVQVLVNLLDNAIQCDATNGPILLILEEGTEHHLLHVEDVGPGIPGEHLGRVFEPFFSTRKGGTGLGLTLVKHLVEQHGGQVSLRNNAGRPGCTAEVSLPAWTAEEGNGEPA